MKYLLIRDANIEGHCVQTYFCTNGNGKKSFVICGENIAHRFNSLSDAGDMIDRMVSEKGYLRRNMKIIESNTDASMVMPL